jgi:hypothetical protein
VRCCDHFSFEVTFDIIEKSFLKAKEGPGRVMRNTIVLELIKHAKKSYSSAEPASCDCWLPAFITTPQRSKVSKLSLILNVRNLAFAVACRQSGHRTGLNRDVSREHAITVIGALFVACVVTVPHDATIVLNSTNHAPTPGKPRSEV